MRFGVLGPVAVWTDAGDPVPIPGRQVRALLADLLVHAAAHRGGTVSSDRLIEDLWGGAAPANPAGALQVRVSQLRRALAEAEPGGRDLVEARPPGYRLRLEDAALDAQRFTALTSEARASRHPRTRAALLAEALDLWRGEPFADVADEPFAAAAIAQLTEQRLVVLEEHAEARLTAGEHGSLAGELADLVTRHPYRERLRAAHMRALYRSGRQPEALASYQDLRRRLADELGLDPGPDLTALHQALLAQDPAETGVSLEPPTTPPTSLPATNLPAPVSDLIGREEALAQVRRLLDTARLVTLTGSGGVGKTSLALAVAGTVHDSHPDGVWLVELAAIERPEELTEAVLRALEIRDVPAAAEATGARDRLAHALRHRNLLLLLDNCEHLAAPVAELVSWLLRAVGGMRILATSREPLRVPGETLWEVPPLALPADADDPAQLGGASAVRLFVARAAAAGGFTLDADTAPAVAHICRRLDGIPLALELAATRVRGLGVHELAARLDDRFALLGNGHRTAPPRQRTLAAVIDWSWQLLSEPERVVLRRLAVHADGATLAAAEAVCAGDDLPGGEVLDLLASLVDRSLVGMEERGGDGARYRLLESVAAYCLNRMYEVGEVTQVRQRHLDYYLRLAERAEPELYGRGQHGWLRRLDAEAANLRAALEFATRQQPAAEALRLVSVLTWYWFLRGRLAEAARALATALAVPGAAPAALRARVHAWQAGVAVLRGEATDLRARLAELRHRYAGAGEPAGQTRAEQARAEWFLAYASLDLGDLTASGELVDHTLNRFRELGDEWGEAAALATRAKLAHVRADLAGLRSDAERSAELFGGLGDDWGVLQATDWLLGLADLTGDYARAAQLGQEGLQVAQRLGMWPDVAGRLAWLGWLAVQQGDYGPARQWCERALQLAADQGLLAGEVFARIGLAFAARRGGDLEVAGRHLQLLLSAAQRHGSGDSHPLYLSMVLAECGFLAEQQGDPAAALAYHRQAFDVASAQGDTRSFGFALLGAAGALCLAGPAELGAEVLGAADAARQRTALPLALIERQEIDRITAVARTAAGAAGFDAAFARGAALTPQAARSLLEEQDRAARAGHFGP